jgi:hypothetical protein
VADPQSLEMCGMENWVLHTPRLWSRPPDGPSRGWHAVSNLHRKSPDFIQFVLLDNELANKESRLTYSTAECVQLRRMDAQIERLGAPIAGISSNRLI